MNIIESYPIPYWTGENTTHAFVFSFVCCPGEHGPQILIVRFFQCFKHVHTEMATARTLYSLVLGSNHVRSAPLQLPYRATRWCRNGHRWRLRQRGKRTFSACCWRKPEWHWYVINSLHDWHASLSYIIIMDHSSSPQGTEDRHSSTWPNGGPKWPKALLFDPGISASLNIYRT